MKIHSPLGMSKKTVILSLISGLLLSQLSFPLYSNQLTVSFQAIYTAATCKITVPSSVSFNQGAYISGIPSTVIQGDDIYQDFNIRFTDCSTDILPATPKITVSGNIVTLNGTKLFSDNNGSQGQAIGYGIKLSTTGNSLFNSVSNLADLNTISATGGTSVAMLNNQKLPIKAILTCGANDCRTVTTRQSGSFSANIVFRLSYE